MQDLARRFRENPLLKPADIHPSVDGMEVTCLLNPGAFQNDGRTWLLMRVAERPMQVPGKTSFPILNADGRLEVLEFNSDDPRLDLSDPRVINFDGNDYLTTLSHLRLVVSDDGIAFSEPEHGKPLMGHGELETYGIEDCRVARVGGQYCLTYTQVSSNGVGVGLRTTRDWKNLVHAGRLAAPKHRIFVFSAGLLLFFIGAVTNTLLFSAVGVLIFIGCLLLAKPLLDLAYYPIQLQVVDVVSHLEGRNEYAYIFYHEFGLFLGRALGCCLFLGIAFWGSGIAVLKYALPVIALLQLLSIRVVGQINWDLIVTGNGNSPAASFIAMKMEA
jgi:hypothetical protein